MTLATALSQFALARVLNWNQVDRLLELARADIDQALRDQELFRAPDEAQARRVAIVLEMLRTAPFRRSAYYEPRNFATFERTPEPEFSCEGDVRDVDPATVPDLPGLAAVA